MRLRIGVRFAGGSGLLLPEAGRIVMDGRVPSDSAYGIHLTTQARRVGYVFQSSALFPHLTVQENVAFGLRHRPLADVNREVDLGVTRLLMLRLDEPGSAAQGYYGLEIEVPRFVYEVLRIDHHRDWQFSIHPGSICVLPT